VAASDPRAQNTIKRLKEDHVSKMTGLEFEGTVIEAPRCVPWYPEGLAWVFDFPKVALRREATLKEFNSFLKIETAAGTIQRQELVSMIPGERSALYACICMSYKSDA